MAQGSKYPREVKAEALTLVELGVPYQQVADRLHSWSFKATEEREAALPEWALQEWAD